MLRVPTVPRVLTVPAVWCSLLAGCGDGPPVTPTPQPPIVSAVTPPVGPTQGGTLITISGANFEAGAIVTLGGTAAANVVVTGPASITATTPSHAAGVVDVVVTVGGRSGALAAGFTYQVPGPANAPPEILALTAQSPRRNAPPDFADLGEEIAVQATVQDAETPVSQLTFEWAASSGTFTGAGPTVRWRAPASGTTPATSALTLTVVERYQAVDETGQPVTREHRVPRTVTVRVHNSVKEVGDMTLAFLNAFSNSAVPPLEVVKDFTPSCPGRADELKDVENNRATYVIQSSVIGPATVGVVFGGRCPFRDRSGDACAAVPAEWRSTIIATGKSEVAKGTDHVAAVYLQSRWWLCSSDFDGTTTSGLRFMY